MHHHPVLDFLVPKGRRAATRRPIRSGLWGVNVLHSGQQHVQQEELEALEALCFLSVGASTQQVHQTTTQQTKPASNKTNHRHKPASSSKKQKQKHHKPPSHHSSSREKHAASSRRSPVGSETSSGATQCGLTAVQAAELQGQPAEPLADLALLTGEEEVHPAALPPVATLVPASSAQLQRKQHQAADKPGAADSSDTRQVLSGLTPMPSDELMAPESCQDILPVEAATAQRQEAASAGPGGLASLSAWAVPPPAPQTVMQGVVGWVQPQQQGPQQPQQSSVVARPAVKGCFWHVYIAKKIQADRDQQEQQQQKQPKGLTNPKKRPPPPPQVAQAQQQQQQQQRLQTSKHAAAGAAKTGVLAKRRRTEQQHTSHAAAAFVQPQLPAWQQLQQQQQQQQLLLLQHLSQQHVPMAGACALLPQQTAPLLQMLQAASAAAAAPPGLSIPTVAPAAAGGSAAMLQLLSSLPAAAAGQQAVMHPWSAASLAAAQPVAAGLLAQRAPAAPATPSQLQGLVGQLAAAAAAPRTGLLAQLLMGGRAALAPATADVSATGWSGVASSSHPLPVGRIAV